MVSADQTTRQPAWSSDGAGKGDGTMVSLTILAHPDLGRIGDGVVLPELRLGHAVGLSRAEPELAPPGAVWDGRPLEDPYLSRRPWRIVPMAGGIRLERSGSSIDLAVAGPAVEQPVAETHEFSEARLEDGVVLVLARRIALLLHQVPNVPPAGAAAASAMRQKPGWRMVGASARLMDVRAAIERVADLEVPVLLRGESGTGKELAARALHDRGRRASRPFVAVNLGALSPALAASELFGHAKGAFTGAVAAREGYFRAAEGGTLFLDEVGEAPDEVQAMLLRALENQEVVPVGAHTPRKVDVRLVAATDSDLEGRARRGDFKEPLLHRLSAYEIQLPALRERRDDIGRLVVHFARGAREELGSPMPGAGPGGDAPPWLPAPLMARLATYHWPGNVRQLRNVVRQLVIDSRSEKTLQMGSRLEALLAEGPTAQERTTPDLDESDLTGDPEQAPPPRRPADVTDDELEAALRACRFEPAAAARQLGISRPSIYNLIRQHPRLRTPEDLSDGEIDAALTDGGDEVGKAAKALSVSTRALARRLARRTQR